MGRSYELWSADTANLAGTFASEDDALVYVREMIAEHGAEAVAPWGLLWWDEVNESLGGLVAQDEDLIRLARERSERQEAD